MKVFIGNMNPVRVVETKPLPKFEPVKPYVEPEPIIPHVEPIIPKIKKKTKDRKVRSVSFSLTDPNEVRLKKFTDKHSCFSTYVKGLIQRDMAAHYNV